MTKDAGRGMREMRVGRNSCLVALHLETYRQFFHIVYQMCQYAVCAVASMRACSCLHASLAFGLDILVVCF